MKILILNWRDLKNPKSGGAEIVTHEHAKAWVKAGNQVTWFTSTFNNSKSEEVIDGIEIIRKGNAFNVFLYAFLFYKFTNKKFDIVIDEIHGIPFFTPLYINEPKIAFIHEIAGEIWNYMYPFPLNLIGQVIEKIYLKLYKNINFWVDADSTVNELIQYGINKNNILAIPCPINNKVINYLPKKALNYNFIFVSRLVKMKGIENVLLAFSEILKTEPKSQLIIVGKGEEVYEKKLKKLTKQLLIDKNTIFLGYVNDKEKLELMRRAHILLHASIKEGWGLVVLEAASQGTPSVVYNVAGLRDTVKNGKTGIVIDSNEPNQLAEIALKLVKNKKIYKNMQLNGLQWVKSISWDKSSKQSLNLIKLLVKNNKI